MSKHSVPAQFARFFLVGACATSVHYAVLIALRELAGMNVVLATSIGFACGAVVGYTLNRRFTFESQAHLGKSAAKYVLVLVLGLGLNAAIVWQLTHMGVYYLWAQFIATLIVMFWNFAGSRWIAFR